jgi:ABC-type transport system involved in cytochrome bd biosynthesis fused ATPase/permease subunit
MKSFDSKQLRLILLGLLGLTVIVFIAVVFLGLSLLSKDSQKMVGLKLQSAAAQNQLTSLGVAKKEIKQYGYFKTVAQEVIPNDKDQANAVLQLNQFAAAAGFGLQAITFPTSTLGVSSLATGAVAAGNAQTAPAVALLSQALPVVGIAGLYSVQLTITPQTDQDLPADQQVTYNKLIDFLNRIENNQRTAQITQVVVRPLYNSDGSFRALDFTLIINIFIKR